MRRWLVASAVAAALVVALALRMFVFPDTGPTEHADAVVVLAGQQEARLPAAIRLAERGPRVLVVSAAEGVLNAPARALCRDRHDLTLYCFTPNPSNTRGEARSIGRLVEEHGWRRITVVTSSYHVARAGLLIRRCTDAGVQMVAAREPIPLRQWVVVIGHETAGLAGAAVREAC